jgi:hypothetical protein
VLTSLITTAASRKEMYRLREVHCPVANAPKQANKSKITIMLESAYFPAKPDFLN